jgi:hypothetical protein
MRKSKVKERISKRVWMREFRKTHKFVKVKGKKGKWVKK